jgi:hypothetical protein
VAAPHFEKKKKKKVVVSDETSAAANGSEGFGTVNTN